MSDRKLYLLFTASLCRRDPLETLELALEGGVDAVQFREKRIDRRCRRLLGRVLEACKTRGVPCIVNDHVALAAEVGAGGAHVGQDDMPVAEARRLLPAHMLLGVSTHDPVQAEAAVREGADHLGAGPCFATSTKGYARGIGSAAVAAIRSAVSVPVFAIGGITARNLPMLLRRGIDRIAVSAAILTAEDPRAAASALRSALQRPG